MSKDTSVNTIIGETILKSLGFGKVHEKVRKIEDPWLVAIARVAETFAPIAWNIQINSKDAKSAAATALPSITLDSSLTIALSTLAYRLTENGELGGSALLLNAVFLLARNLIINGASEYANRHIHRNSPDSRVSAEENNSSDNEPNQSES